jgi:uncharacterized membrane protein YgaE (UPF0421/DUF939 family)
MKTNAAIYKKKMKGNVKSWLEEFTQKNEDTTNRQLEMISIPLLQETKKVGRKHKVMDDRLEAIESETRLVE